MAKAFGLDISDYSIEALVLKGGADKPKVASSKRTVLDAGMVKNGEVRRRKGLATKLKDVVAKASPKPIKEDEVIVGVPDSRVMTHIFELPGNLKEEQVAGIIENEIENVFPVSLAEIYWDYKIIARTEMKIEAFVAAAPRKIIDGLKRLCQDAGLKPVVFDLEANALARILIPKEQRAETLLVDIGARTTKVSYFDQQGINFISVIDLAGEDFTQKISDKLGVSESKAKNIKKKDGIILPKGKRKNKVLLALRSDLNNMVKEIQRNVEFCESRSGAKINKIILSGGTSMMPGLVEYLKKKLKLEVGIGVEKVHFSTRSARIRGPLFFAVDGLALRGLEKNFEKTDLNLLPGRAKAPKEHKEEKGAAKSGLKPKRRKKDKAGGERDHKRTWLLLGILILALIILAGALFAYQEGYIGSYKEDKKSAQESVKGAAADSGPAEEQVAQVIFSEKTLEVDVSGMEVKKDGAVTGQLTEQELEGGETFNTEELSEKTGALPADAGIVSQNNVNLAKEELVKKLVDENLDGIRNKNAMFVVVPEVIDYNITQSTTSVTPGTEASRFELNVKAKPVLLMMSRQETLGALNQGITDEADKITDAELDSLQYEILNYYRNSGIIKLTVSRP